MADYAPFVAAPRSNRDLAQAAVDMLVRYRPELLKTPGSLDILELLDDLEDGRENVVFGTRDLEPGLEGFTDPERREIIVDYLTVYSAARAGDGHARQTCAHEVGHIQHISQVTALIKHFTAPQLNRVINVRVAPFRHPEVQAHRFGQALLMPPGPCAEVYRAGGLGAVRECFQVSGSNALSWIKALQREGWL